MKRRVQLIARGSICQHCGQKRAVVLFRNRTWCLVDAINEVIALRDGLVAGASQHAG